MKTIRIDLGMCRTCKYSTLYSDICTNTDCNNCPLHHRVDRQFHTCVCLQETDFDYCEYYEEKDA